MSRFNLVFSSAVDFSSNSEGALICHVNNKNVRFTLVDAKGEVLELTLANYNGLESVKISLEYINKGNDFSYVVTKLNSPTKINNAIKKFIKNNPELF